MATAKRQTVTINRAPVLALWATVVAERLGFGRDEALSLGKAVTGLNAQSKGQRLGIYRKHEMRKPGRGNGRIRSSYSAGRSRWRGHRPGLGL